MDKLHRFTVVVCCLLQAIGILIAWPVWTIRLDPPNLPVSAAIPQWSSAWPLLASLACIPVFPKVGSILHACVFFLSVLADQTRLQPQFLGLAVYLLCLAWNGRWTGQMWLSVMWTWAGLHKLLSPDWLGEQSWRMCAMFLSDPSEVYRPIGVCIASVELMAGVLVFIRPHWSGLIAIPFHVAIALLLSPLVADWNSVVIPWNIATAIVAWIWLIKPPVIDGSAKTNQPSADWSKLKVCVAVFAFIAPMFFYVGWIDHYLAFVLYSDNIPRGLITTPSGVHEIDTQESLRVPFPNERRLIRQYFELTSAPGSKLHLADPRGALSDEYWLRDHEGISQINLQTFLAEDKTVDPSSVRGVLLDDRRAVFRLATSGAELLKRTEADMVYAIRFSRADFKVQQLRWLSGLPNLEEIELAGCRITDADIENLPMLPKLRAIGLADTLVTANVRESLKRFPRLQVIEFERPADKPDTEPR